MILGPSSGDLTPDEVADAYPWPADAQWVRAMMVTTLDGAAAGPDGLSGSISSSVDRDVFDAVRRFADVVLVGGGTFRAEGYGPMTAKEGDAERRQEAGQSAAPTLAIVSGSLNLDWDSPTFTESTHRPIVFTGPMADHPADSNTLARAEATCEIIAASEPHVPPSFIVDQLTQRGLRHIVCEGGPSLLEGMVAADLLDEADITLSPVFAGTAQTPRTDALEEVSGFDLAHVLTAEGFLMNRYVKPTSDVAA